MKNILCVTGTLTVLLLTSAALGAAQKAPVKLSPMEELGKRDKTGAQWPAPEVAANVNRAEMGNLGLTEAEEGALVVFMKTLSDRR